MTPLSQNIKTVSDWWNRRETSKSSSHFLSDDQSLSEVPSSPDQESKTNWIKLRIRTEKMQDREISIKSGIDKFFDFGYKVLYGGFEEKPLNLGRECGEALDSRLHHSEESSVVLIEDRRLCPDNARLESL